MTMTPEHFHDLLERATATAPPDSIDTSVAIRTGRRSLHRRRLTASAGVAAVTLTIAGLAGGRAVLAPQGSDIASEPPSTDTQLLTACHGGNQSAQDTALIFGNGTPTVEQSVRTAHQVIVAIQSADDRYWAECFVHLDSAEFGSGMTVFASDSDSPAGRMPPSYTTGVGCGLVDGEIDTSCRLWSVNLVDRLPADVAAVRYGFGDGTSRTEQTRNGYVVLNHLGTLPDGGTATAGSNFLGGFEPLASITYLDAQGTAIAGLDTSDNQRLPGLPALSAYPSIRGEERY